MLNSLTHSETWWPTQMLVKQVQDCASFNSRLKSIILEKEAELTSRGRGVNVAGLESGLTTYWMEYNVLNWDFPECRQLSDIVVEGIREYIRLIGKDPDHPDYEILGISCWANVLRYGQDLKIHHHDPSFLSAHYGVQSGVDDENPQIGDSGHTVYYRPGFMDRDHEGIEGVMTSPWNGDWRISKPSGAGSLRFFPSYVRHEVRPNLSRKERITIAMDIFVRAQKPTIFFHGPRWYKPLKASLA